MIRTAIVGCGRIFSKHFQALLENKQAQLKVICDIDKNKLEGIISQYKVEVTSDFNSLIRREDIDLIDICTPSGLHAKMAIEALKNNKHVIVEKPMALKISDADKMIKTAKAYKKKLCVVLQNRYNPPMQELKIALDKKLLGKVCLVNVTVRWYRPQEYYDDGWHGTRKVDGGVLMNQAIHHIDALQWLMGMPESVFCYKDTLCHRMEMEDTAVAVFKYSNGALANIEVSTITWPHNLEGSIALFGEKGSVKVGGVALNKKSLWLVKDQESEWIENETDYAGEEKSSIYGESHRMVINDMIEAIEKNREPTTNGEEGLKSLQLVHLLYKSADLRREVSCDKTT